MAERFSNGPVFVKGEPLPLIEYAITPESNSLLPPVVERTAKSGEQAVVTHSLAPDERIDLTEYLVTLEKTARQERESRGISSNAEYYSLIETDKNLENEIFQSVVDRLHTNPRAIELMEQFGVKV